MTKFTRKSSQEWGFESQFGKSEQRTKPDREDICWLQKHTPKTRKDLVTHSKKLDRVQSALSDSLHKSRRRCKVLVLSGPSGVGKSATVRALANDLQCSIEEWVNPIVSYEKGVYYEAEIDKFKNFLLSSSRYASILESPHTSSTSNGKKIVLIEELPSVVNAKQVEFWDIIKTYSQVGRHPVVLVLTDGVVKNLRIPPEYQNISFNPVAPTLLTRALKNICQKEKIKEERIEEIVLQSDGDLRNAILALQFNSKAETSRQSNKRRKIDSKKSTWSRSRSQSSSETKDSRLFLFHALAKILYAKRIEGSPLDSDDVTLGRTQLEFVPEDVADKCAMSSSWIAEFLHHNYLQFRTTLENTLLPSNMLCDSDIMTSHFVTDDDCTARTESFAKSIVTRAMIYSKDPGFVPKFTPLCRSVQRDITRTCQENITQCNEVFALRHLGACSDFLTDTLPFFKPLRYRPSNTDEHNIIHTMTHFKNNLKFGSAFNVNDDGDDAKDEIQTKRKKTAKEDQDVDTLSAELEQEIEDFSD